MATSLPAPEALAATTQYAYRSLKTTGLVNGPPLCSHVESYQKPEGTIRCFVYSADGSRYASAGAEKVQVFDASTGALLTEIAVPSVLELSFSPKGTWLSTWERYVKPADDNAQHKNLRVWQVQSGTEVTAFSQKSIEGWALQYTDDESSALRLVSSEIQVYVPSDFSRGVTSKLRLDGITDYRLSPGRNPNIAAFVGERKGAPASLKVYSLLGLSSAAPVGQKTFFKADKVQIKWNQIGTSVLFLTQTEVDKTGKSYYGETNLYLMSIAGSHVFDCRVTLDREGGIHDFAWAPNGKEFAVSYGYMPAKTTIFDHRSNVVHDFGTAPRNFLSYNPQGRLLLIAGFGNLAGTMDVWDRQALKKVATIEASNTVHCEWSPDGRFILCATLSPRLRVDNGIRLFHYSGVLMHEDTIHELYAAKWRPAPAEVFPFRQSLSPPPTPAASMQGKTPATPAKAAGAYRPPHARGTMTPTHFKREDEGGAPYIASSNGHVPGGPTNGSGGMFRPPGAGPRRIPGAAIPGAGPPKPNAPGEGKKKKGLKTANSNPAKKRQNSKSPSPQPPDQTNPTSNGIPLDSTPQEQPIPNEEDSKTDVVTLGNSKVPLGQLSPTEKRQRALMKKLTAIEQLKERKKRGEKLEQTQLKKIESESETRKELESL